MAPFGTHYLYDRVVIISTRWVNGDTCWLVNDNYIIVFMDDANRLRCYRRFMAMQCMGDNIAVLDDFPDRGDLQAIDYNFATLNSFFLLPVRFAY